MHLPLLQLDRVIPDCFPEWLHRRVPHRPFGGVLPALCPWQRLVPACAIVTGLVGAAWYLTAQSRPQCCPDGRQLARPWGSDDNVRLPVNRSQ